MKKQCYIGIDVGGTKIAGALVSNTGNIIERYKIPTPLHAPSKEIISLVSQFINTLLKESDTPRSRLGGIGMGIPGIVDTKKQKIIVTPNMNLSGCALVQKIKERFRVPIVMGNDVNLGLLGEKWLGAARNSDDVIGIFPGTGIGGALLHNNQLLAGSSGAAGEIGHMIMDINGPRCSCGNHGCLEALASRWAIERDIRLAIGKGKKSIITKLTKGRIKTIKSKLLKQALQKKDPVVTPIMKRVAEILGKACISIRHIFDPELIVLGGGVIEACGFLILPKVEKMILSDKFFSKLTPCKVNAAALGDDAIILGAVAFLQQSIGINPFKQKPHPLMRLGKNGAVIVKNTPYKKSFYIRADGKIKIRKDAVQGKIEIEELKKICKKKPDVVIVGTKSKRASLSKQAIKYLKNKEIKMIVAPKPLAIDYFNTMMKRKAFLIAS